MKSGEKFLLWIFCASVGVLFTFHLNGCSAGLTKQIIKSAIDVALAACIAENPGADEKELKAVCQYTDEVAPMVRELMAAQRKGMVRGNCSPTTVKVVSPDAGK